MVRDMKIALCLLLLHIQRVATEKPNETVFVKAGSNCVMPFPFQHFENALVCRRNDVILFSNYSINPNLDMSTKSRIELDDNRILIKNFTVMDTGIYKCNAQRQNTIWTYLIEACILSQPEVINVEQEVRPHEVYGIEGIPLNLTCNVKSGIPPNETLEWKLNGRSLIIGGPLKLAYTFKPLKVHHKKNFTCNANNIMTETSVRYYVTLLLIFKPVVRIDVFPGNYVKDGQQLFLKCYDKSDTRLPNYTWTHNLVEISNGSQWINYTSAIASHGGNYSCLIQNAAGEDTGHTTIVVGNKDDNTIHVGKLENNIAGMVLIIIIIAVVILCYCSLKAKEQSNQREDDNPQNIQDGAVENEMHEFQHYLQPGELPHLPASASGASGRIHVEISKSLNYVEINFGPAQGNTFRIRGMENRTSYAEIDFLAENVEALSSSSDSDISDDDDFMYIEPRMDDMDGISE